MWSMSWVIYQMQQNMVRVKERFGLQSDELEKVKDVSIKPNFELNLPIFHYYYLKIQETQT